MFDLTPPPTEPPRRPGIDERLSGPRWEASEPDRMTSEHPPRRDRPGPPTHHAPPKLPPPSPPTRRRRALTAPALAAVALPAGGVGGFVAGQVDDGGSSETPAARADATPVNVGRSDGDADVAALVKSLQPSVVSIDAKIRQTVGPFISEGHGAGTGIVLDDGYILTNAHVVHGASEVTVTPANGADARPATIVGGDLSADIAVLHVDDTSGLQPAELGDSDRIQVGEDAVAIGNALSLEGGLSVTRGIVSGLNRSMDTEFGTLTGLIQTDAAISSGNSGGPLVNADGEVIGVNTAVIESNGRMAANNIGFAISIDKAMQTVERIIAD